MNESLIRQPADKTPSSRPHWVDVPPENGRKWRGELSGQSRMPHEASPTFPVSELDVDSLHQPNPELKFSQEILQPSSKIVIVSKGDDMVISSEANPELRDDLKTLTEPVRDFALRRDWYQFHASRNLILALVGETGELAAEFKRKDDDADTRELTDPEMRLAVGSKFADVLTYRHLLRLADVLAVNIKAELRATISLNESRYLVGRTRGYSAKHTAYE